MFSRFLAVTPSGLGSQQGWVPYALDARLEMDARALRRYGWGWAKKYLQVYFDETMLHGIPELDYCIMSVWTMKRKKFLANTGRQESKY